MALDFITDADPDIVTVEDFPSTDGVWQRAVTYANGNYAVFHLVDDDGNERKATLEEIKAYHGACDPPTWWERLWGWLTAGHG